MTEKMMDKVRKREKRFRYFLNASTVFHGLALGLFFLGVWPGGIHGCAGACAVFFGIGSLLSWLAGINANYFWGVTEGVITSKEQYEELRKLCEGLE